MKEKQFYSQINVKLPFELHEKIRFFKYWINFSEFIREKLQEKIDELEKELEQLEKEAKNEQD